GLQADGVVLSNPALHQAFKVPSWKIVGARVLSRVLPQVSLPTGLEADQLSTNSEANADYAADPLIFSGGTTRWGWEYICAQQALEDATLQTDVPLLLLLGSADPIIDASFTQRWIARSNGLSLTVRNYPNLMHELSNEPTVERERVFEDLIQWLLERVASAAAD
ncbi:MAG: hypothetical protein CMH53_02750, partial [Myxococcales bacterium]|nr:hypothetical protein [Myxococcales bacterium]